MNQPIGIVELYQHNEVLTHYCDLLLYKNHKLYVFCNKDVFLDLPQSLKNSSIIWFLRDAEESIDKFIKNNEASLKECGFLLVTTVFSHFISFTKLASWAKTALIVHSAHTWLKPFEHIHLRKGHKTADFLRLLKFILLRQASLRTKLLKEVRYIGLPNDAILNYVQSNFKAPGKSDFVTIPFGAFAGSPETNIEKNSTVFTITGSLGDDVRDYESVLEAIKFLLPSLNNKIQLVFLGKPKKKLGQHLKNTFDSINHPLLEIITFSRYISQADFDNYLFKTDYLILPLKKYTQFHVFRELTCLSKLSGSVNDMIRYGVPAIASKNCRVDEVVDQSLIYYENPKELANLILGLSSKEKAIRTKDDLTSIFSNYLIDKLYQDLLKIITE